MQESHAYDFKNHKHDLKKALASFQKIFTIF